MDTNLIKIEFTYRQWETILDTIQHEYWENMEFYNELNSIDSEFLSKLDDQGLEAYKNQLNYIKTVVEQKQEIISVIKQELKKEALKNETKIK